MSQETSPITYEKMMALFLETREQFRETREQFKETREQIAETARIAKKTQKKLGQFSTRFGEIIEKMLGGDNIIKQFQNLGYADLDFFCENQKFRNKKLGIKGEIDLFIENGVVAILIEVKTTLETEDVRKHIQRMEEFRRCVEAKGGDKRRFVGAVAGAVIKGDAAEFAIENGLYVIAQAGNSFQIVAPPEGFVAKEW